MDRHCQRQKRGGVAAGVGDRAGAQVDEGLHGLVRVSGDILALRSIYDGDGVVGEGGEVGDAAVDVGGFVDADKGFVEDREEVAEELEGDGLQIWSVSNGRYGV